MKLLMLHESVLVLSFAHFTQPILETQSISMYSFNSDHMITLIFCNDKMNPAMIDGKVQPFYKEPHPPTNIF